MSDVSEIRSRVRALQRDAETARESEYATGFQAALADVIEIIDDYLWEAGDYVEDDPE